MKEEVVGRAASLGLGEFNLKGGHDEVDVSVCKKNYAANQIYDDTIPPHPASHRLVLILRLSGSPKGIVCALKLKCYSSLSCNREG